MMHLYDVTYQLTGEFHHRMLRCITEDGETTTDDFPKMIAIREFNSSERVDKVTVIRHEFVRTL